MRINHLVRIMNFSPIVVRHQRHDTTVCSRRINNLLPLVDKTETEATKGVCGCGEPASYRRKTPKAKTCMSWGTVPSQTV